MRPWPRRACGIRRMRCERVLLCSAEIMQDERTIRGCPVLGSDRRHRLSPRSGARFPIVAAPRSTSARSTPSPVTRWVAQMSITTAFGEMPAFAQDLVLRGRDVSVKRVLSVSRLDPSMPRELIRAPGMRASQDKSAPSTNLSEPARATCCLLHVGR